MSGSANTGLVRRAWRGGRYRVGTRAQRWFTKRFHRLFYESHAWWGTRWLGVRVLKNPFDLWIFQEIVSETRPEVIVETGTYDGGSALYLASICEFLDAGEVISVDIEPLSDTYPRHRRISYLAGRSSVDPGVVDEVRRRIAGRRAMVILDSDHAAEHVEAELDAYAPFVAPGCYLIVEDTNIGRIRRDLLPGPREAVESFLLRAADFEVDTDREKFLVTFNPGGYLRRVR